MSQPDRTTVTDKRGVTGTITTRVVEPNNVAVEVEGLIYLVPRSALVAGDEGYHVHFSFEGLPTVPIHPAHLLMSETSPSAMSDQTRRSDSRSYVEETVVTESLPVQPNLSDEAMAGALSGQQVEVEDVSIERVPMDQIVEAPPGVRQEGDVTIIPVVEEFLVVQKKLRVKEEIRVTKTKRSLSANDPARKAHLA